MKKCNIICKFIEIGIILSLLIALVIILFPIGMNMQAYADEVVPNIPQDYEQYELKIKINGEYYWIIDDGCDNMTDECDCEIVSNEPTALIVGEEFNIESFIWHIGKEEWSVEGKYIVGFRYEDTAMPCIFASNVVLSLGIENPVIEPIYENEHYTIAFDGNGADGELIAPATYEYGEELLLPEPERAEYTFLGWQYNGEDFNHETMPDVTPGIAESDYSITLQAKWRSDFFMVTFVQENGSTTLRVKYGEPIGELPDIYENGYPFISFRAEGSDKNYTSETVWDIDEDTVLYIVRGEEPIQYSINYDGAGGSLIGTIESYNVEQLPLELEYTAEREFDYINGISLNGTELENDILPAGTAGNIIIKAVWKAVRHTSSSKATVTSETFSAEYCVVDCTNINLVAVRTMTIAASVKEIAFIGNYDDYVISKQIVVSPRTEELIIHIKELNWGSPFWSSLIIAQECPTLTLNCVGENRLHGGLVLGEMITEYLAVINCPNLIITGDRLTVIGSPGYGTVDGGMGICGLTIDEDGEIDAICGVRIEIDYLYVKGGQGGIGLENSPDGGNGGTAIAFLLIVIAEHEGQSVTFEGGDAGTAEAGGENGEPGNDYEGILIRQ